MVGILPSLGLNTTDIVSLHGHSRLADKAKFLAQFTVLIRVYLAAPPYHQWDLDIFNPEGINVNKFKQIQSKYTWILVTKQQPGF
jgi:hypothetical protein